MTTISDWEPSPHSPTTLIQRDIESGKEVNRITPLENACDIRILEIPGDLTGYVSRGRYPTLEMAKKSVKALTKDYLRHTLDSSYPVPKALKMVPVGRGLQAFLRGESVYLSNLEDTYNVPSIRLTRKMVLEDKVQVDLRTFLTYTWYIEDSKDFSDLAREALAEVDLAEKSVTSARQKFYNLLSTMGAEDAKQVF